MRDRTGDVLGEGFTDHVLVCTNDRDADYACCADVRGSAVAAAVKDWLRDRDVFWSRVRVAETSCLGLCSEGGAAVAIQPRNRWYSDVRPAEVPDLLAAELGPEATRLGAAPGDAPASRSQRADDD